MDTTHDREDSDSDLLGAVAAGGQAAFERLYHRYEKRLYQYVYTLVNDQTVAEDVVGETMIAIWRGAGSFSGTSRLSTWIFGIARHKSLDALRRAGRRQREVDLDGAADLPSSCDSPLEGVHRKQVESLTKRALAMLSPEHQEILRLVFYEELPYDEISTMLGIPSNTVKTRVFYAKQHLKRTLERLNQKTPMI
jgi:RNA polymerase sigma-70 factor (ECF subfamily)